MSAVLPFAPGCVSSSSTKQYDVVIIGAGLAGLMAGRELAKAGLSIRILEAQDRPGGRAYTGDDLPDRPEYGGIQVGSEYKRFRTLADELNVEIAPFPHTDIFRSSLLDVNGGQVTAREWKTADINQLMGKEKALPLSALGFLLIRDGNPFKSPTDWQSAEMAAQDRSIIEVLKEREASDEALRLIEHTANNNGIAHSSVFNEWRSQYLWTAGSASDVVTDGTARLPEAMADSLAQHIDYGAEVQDITASDSGISITTTDGRNYSADFCISTMPLPAYRTLSTNLDLPDLFKEAVTGNHYTNITHLFIDTEPFWEKDDKPPMIWSDGPLERFFPRVTPNGDIVGYKIWLNGAGAQMADNTSHEDLQALVQKQLLRIRPASNGKARLAKVMSWQKEPNYHGAYMHWPAGKTAAMSKAVRTPIGRMHFAGEHTSLYKTGLEGALESGERAAQRILEQVS